jgi:hypothetical protein
MRARSLVAIALVSGAIGALPVLHQSWSQTRPMAAPELRPASSFANISDERARSVALFQEAGKVLMHPRCVNCHPASDRPNQTDSGHPHQPLVVRGPNGHGATGMACTTCHGKANFEASKVPGHPNWHLAPLSMAWEGKSLGQICEQIKDPARNDGMDMPKLLHHVAEDSLVGWAWSPGGSRTPAPGTQAEFGALMKAWAEAGAYCPAS